MKKKIGIITVSRTTNFGAELQAFALQYKLNKLGYDAEVIDYLYFKNNRHIVSKKARPELSFKKKEQLKNLFIYRIIGPLIDVAFPIFHKKTNRKFNNFKNFHKNNTRFSKEFRTADSLYKHSFNYDIFITGSDQVWNPATFSSLKPYLLDFAPPFKKRISYAASFGVSKVSSEYKNTYSGLFKKLDSISVREEQGKEIIKEITNLEANEVLDPTLLLSKSDWKEIAKGSKINIKEPYILIYDLHPSPEIIELANKTAAKLNCRVYRICKRAFSNPKNNGIKNIDDAGPTEFVSLFMKATYVITNSFHGVIFSTNFNIPFNAVLNPKRKNNSRILNFLSYVNLSNRIVWEDNKDHYPIDLKLNFEDVNLRLYKKRKTSVEFLNYNILN